MKTTYHGILYEGLDPLMDSVYQRIMRAIAPYNSDTNVSPLKEISSKLLAQDLQYEPVSQRVDSYNKVTHIITRGKYIIPIEPSGVQHTMIINESMVQLNVITNIPQSMYPTYESVQTYIKPLPYKVKGIIVQNNNVVNLVFTKNVFIPIQPIKYNRKIHKYPIVGTIDMLYLNDMLSLNKFKPIRESEFMDEFHYETKIYDVFHRTILPIYMIQK